MEDTPAQLAAVAAYEAEQKVAHQEAHEEILWLEHYMQEEDYYRAMAAYLQSDAYLDGKA